MSHGQGPKAVSIRSYTTAICRLLCLFFFCYKCASRRASDTNACGWGPTATRTHFKAFPFEQQILMAEKSWNKTRQAGNTLQIQTKPKPSTARTDGTGAGSNKTFMKSFTLCLISLLLLTAALLE